MIKVIGLTGGIGSGKSAVARIIRDQGIPVIDADLVARQVTVPGQPAYLEIAKAWPEVVGSDGRIDRGKLAGIVFADAQSRKRLEAITHPRIRLEIAAQSAALEAAGHRLAFLEAALLVETGTWRTLDGLVVVTADPQISVERVLRRDGRSREQVQARMAAQLPIDEKTRVAGHVIDNNGTLEGTTRQVLRILQELQAPRS